MARHKRERVLALPKEDGETGSLSYYCHVCRRLVPQRVVKDHQGVKVHRALRGKTGVFGTMKAQLHAVIEIPRPPT